MQKAEMPTAEQIKAAREAELKKIMSLPRKDKRARLRIRQPWSSSSHGRVRSGVPTGTTPHFRAWMADLRAKSILQSMRLDGLADAPQPGRVASTLAIIRVNSRMRSVWDLSQARIEDLLRIPQIGPARLAEIEQYLKGRNVPVAWTAA